MRARMLKKLKEVSVALRRRRHESIDEQGRYVQALIRGHEQYYGVPFNSRAIGAFRYQVIRLWQKWLSRRSERAYVDWDRMQRYIDRWVPAAVICHPFPSVRFGGCPEVRAGYGKSVRPDLGGGWRVISIPTAIKVAKLPQLAQAGWCGQELF